MQNIKTSNFSLYPAVKYPHNPIFYCQERSSEIQNTVNANLIFKNAHVEKVPDHEIKSAVESLRKVRLHSLTEMVLRVINFVMKLFKKNFITLDNLGSSD